MTEQRVDANGVSFAYLEAGPTDGPLALCLHGFPDSARTWRHLLPRLAGAGFHAVAPWMRGYHPTSVPADGNYQRGALSADANALHEAFGGDDRAVLIGHDWGALAAYGAAAHEPKRWNRVVTMAVPPLAIAAAMMTTYEQTKRSFYIWLFQTGLAESVVSANNLAFIDGLWADWSPGYDATEDLAHVKDALGPPESLAAAIGYYRAMFDPSKHDPALADLEAAAFQPMPQATLYLHGLADGCFSVIDFDAVRGMLAPGSDVVALDGAGHFLHLEQPEPVAERVLKFVTRAEP